MLLCAVCAEAITPTTVVSSKKNKKKQSTAKKVCIAKELMSGAKKCQTTIH